MAHSPRKPPPPSQSSPAASTAHDYFAFLARTFPVMCSSDEFHFMPRAEQAYAWLDQLDDLGSDSIQRTCEAIRSFRTAFERTSPGSDLQTAIDLDMLAASCNGVLIELEQHLSWKSNPLLYLKIVFIGLDQALNKPCPDHEEHAARLSSRLSQALQVLNQACSNLSTTPASQHAAALNMIEDGKTFLQEAFSLEHPAKPKINPQELDRLDRALEKFARFLHARAPVPDSLMARNTLEVTLRDHFLDSRSLAELESLAEDDYASALSRLKNVQARLDPHRSWEELYHGLATPDLEARDTLPLYQREIQALQDFFRPSVFAVDPEMAPLELVDTPTYLRRVRSSASFCAALTRAEPSFFFLSPEPPRSDGQEAARARSQRLNREFHFLTAHETIPGHHLLDARRRSLANPVRRQLESPLFYEGWATYAETLLREQGYLQGTANEFLEEKRRLWRAARCLIDLRRHSGAYDREQSARLLVRSGFSRPEALTQVDRFQLNPGYQVCYTSGLLELQRLRKAWGPVLGAERFHELVLGLGELPFDHLERCLRL